MNNFLKEFQKALLEADDTSAKKDVVETSNIFELKNEYYRKQGFYRQQNPHPAIRKLLVLYRKNNPTIYEILQPKNCDYFIGKFPVVKTACVFFDEIEKKFCFAYNPKFLNKQIKNYKELLASGKLKSKDDVRIDQDELEYENLKKLNFIIAHEVDHILKGDITRQAKFFSQGGTAEEHKVSNYATDGVNNQELLDTQFKLGGSLGYEFIHGGILSKRNEELFKKYGIKPDLAFILSEISKEKFDFLENSDTYFKWIMKHYDEFLEYQKKKSQENQDSDENDEDDDEDEYEYTISFNVGDPIFIPSLNKYGKITSIQGDDIDYDEITKEEAKAIAKGQPTIEVSGMILNKGTQQIKTLEDKLVEIFKRNKNDPVYKKQIIQLIFDYPTGTLIQKLFGGK